MYFTLHTGYLTVDLWGLDTTARNVPRNQTVGGLTFPITPSSVDSVTVLTMISGMKLVNQLGPTYDLSVKTLWTPGNINVNYFV